MKRLTEQLDGSVVIASSFDDKASAVQSRNALKASYPGAWLLYRK